MNLKEIKGDAWEEFSADFPNLAADIEMYKAGSPAVNSLDTIVARRAWSVFERAYVAGAASERNKLAAWMRDYGYATGHGDTMEQLCDALGTEIVDSIEAEVAAEREACAKVIEGISNAPDMRAYATAIRLRGQA